MMNNVTFLIGVREKNEEPNSRGSGRGEAAVLGEHEMKVVIGGKGDERVERGVREMIFEGKWRFNGED